MVRKSLVLLTLFIAAPWIGCNFIGSSNMSLSSSGPSATLGTVSSNFGVSMLGDLDTEPVRASLISGQYAESAGIFYFVSGSAATGQELWKSDGTTAGTVLVKDINPGPASSNIEQVMPLPGGGVVFFANDGTTGPNLWTSNGTAAGTFSLQHVFNPTNSGCGNGSLISCSVALTSATIFVGDNNVVHGALWRTDGTAAGTSMIETSLGTPLMPSGKITVANGLGYLVGTSGTTTGLWVTDGTSAGTTLLSTLVTSMNSAYVATSGLIYWISFNTTTATYDLWVTNGTPAGTLDIKAGLGSPTAAFATLGGVVYFLAAPVTAQLWTTNGTAAGTTLIIDTGNTTNTSIAALSVVGSLLVFSTQDLDTAGTLTVSPTLWASNGTSAGTTKILTSATINAIGYAFGSLASGSAVFLASDATHGIQPWVTNGTAAGTALIKDINSAGTAGVSGVATATATLYTLPSGLVVFPGNDGVHGFEPWVTDGTAANTEMLDDIYSGAGSSVNDVTLGEVAISPTQVLFQASDPVNGQAVWVTNGTSAGTYLLPTPFVSNQSSFPSTLAAVGSGVVFKATTTASENTLWFTNGNAGGTQQIYDLVANGDTYEGGALSIGNRALIPVEQSVVVSGVTTEYWNLLSTDGTAAGTISVAQAPFDSLGLQPAAVTGGAVFCVPAASPSPTPGATLWKTDGTIAGTSQLTQINSTIGSCPQLVSSGGLTFFQGYSAADGEELWKSDGTVAGTAMVKDIYPGAIGSAPTIIEGFKGGVLFYATDPVLGYSLFYSDGTAANTAAILPLGDESAGAPGFGTPSKTEAVFLYNDVVHGLQPWVTDGTAAGTHVLPLFTTANPSTSSEAVTPAGLFFFAVVDGTACYLARTDGTVAGTMPILPYDCDAGFPQFSSQSVVNGILYLMVTTSVGHELWKTDGTTAGTSMVRQWLGGDAPAFNAHAVGNLLVFTSSDAIYGSELWQSDGTTQGTTLIADINPGPADSNAAFEMPLGNGFIFSASDGLHGSEPWIAMPK